MKALNEFYEGRELLYNLPPEAEVHLTGSRYLGGYTEDSDYDYIVYSPTPVTMPIPWILGGSDVTHRESYSWKAACPHTGDDYTLNAIMTHDKSVYNKWVRATLFCKMMGPLSKEKRVECFNYVFNGFKEKELEPYSYPTGYVLPSRLTSTSSGTYYAPSSGSAASVSTGMPSVSHAAALSTTIMTVPERDLHLSSHSDIFSYMYSRGFRVVRADHDTYKMEYRVEVVY